MIPALLPRQLDRLKVNSGNDIVRSHPHASMNRTMTSYGPKSLRQATGMLRYWAQKPSIKSIADNIRTLSSWVQIICPIDGFQKWKKIYQATLTFRNYMTRIYEEEKQALNHEKAESNNLMTSLIRASQHMTEEIDAETVNMEIDYSSQEQKGLTESETYCKIFAFNFAGHDTTAHTLAFGIVLLATRPDVQDWLAEEIPHMLGDQELRDLSYNATFPRLNRCLSVLVCCDNVSTNSRMVN